MTNRENRVLDSLLRYLCLLLFNLAPFRSDLPHHFVCFQPLRYLCLLMFNPSGRATIFPSFPGQFSGRKSGFRAKLVQTLLPFWEMKQHVLIVDDEQQMRDLLSLYLTKHGYEVSVAGTSRETLAIVEQKQIHMVVLDIGLGGEDGLKLLGRLLQLS